MRTAARSDANQKAIMDAARAVGAVVTDIHRHGRGVPDLLISFRGRWYLVEVKDADGNLTKKEREFINLHDAPVYIVRTPEQMIDVLGAL